MIQKNWNDKCAVFGIWNDLESAWMTYLSLYAQQHRGQEGAGIVSLDEGRHRIHRGPGLVGQVFSEQTLKKLKGRAAVGHTRYSTSGRKLKYNIQPLTADLSMGPLAVAHNGNIVNFLALKKELMSQGSIFYGTSDTECLIHFLAREKTSLPLALKTCLPRFTGAYSFVILTDHSLTAVRDPQGFRPLVLGRKKNTSSWVLASETCAFDLIGAEFVREIQPGEIWTISDRGQQSLFLEPSAPSLKQCVFEYVYFARPDSYVFGRSVYQCRKSMGRILARESAVPADMVLPVPDSGTACALGYSSACGVPYEIGIVRNHYIGRTFIHPSQSIRNFRCKIKLSLQKNLLKGKRIVVVDDSIVRGTTARSLVHLLKKAGAKEVHFRVSSPPVTGPCFYGVDTPEKSQLIAAQKTIPEIRDYLQVDSLAFLSHKGLIEAVQSVTPMAGEPSEPKALKNKAQTSRLKTKNLFCSACFTGKYPTDLPYNQRT